MRPCRKVSAAQVLRDYALSDEQAELAERLYSYYRGRGLTEADEALPLCQACSSSTDCWSVRDRDPLDSAGIAIPWIGERYADRRILVVGINFTWGAGGLPIHWKVRTSAANQLRAGTKRPDGSPFAYAVGTYINAAERYLAGQPLRSATTLPSTTAAADAWASCAFTQLVKCSPNRKRNEPYRPMLRNCPGNYLADEFSILRPSTLLLVGKPPQSEVPRLGEVVEWSTVWHFERGHLRVRDLDLEALGVLHPAHWAWKRSYAAMVRSLSGRS